MPQAFLLAVAGAGLYFGGRWAARQLERLAREAERASADLKRRADAERAEEARDLGNLVYDTSTGQYRPRG